MNKKRATLPFILTSLVVIGAVSIGIILHFSLHTTEKLYYIPEVNIYLKIVKPPINKYGYILFSKDSVFSLSDKVDYIKVYKSETANVDIIVDPSNKEKLYLNDRFNFSTFNSVEYDICKIDFKDTLVFSRETVGGVDTYLFKEPFIGISIEGYLESIYMTGHDKAHPSKIEPIIDLR